MIETTAQATPTIEVRLPIGVRPEDVRIDTLPSSEGGGVVIRAALSDAAESLRQATEPGEPETDAENAAAASTDDRLSPRRPRVAERIRRLREAGADAWDGIEDLETYVEDLRS